MTNAIRLLPINASVPFDRNINAMCYILFHGPRPNCLEPEIIRLNLLRHSLLLAVFALRFAGDARSAGGPVLFISHNIACASVRRNFPRPTCVLTKASTIACGNCSNRRTSIRIFRTPKRMFLSENDCICPSIWWGMYFRRR